jgi:hypothetical protein
MWLSRQMQRRVDLSRLARVGLRLARDDVTLGADREGQVEGVEQELECASKRHLSGDHERHFRRFARPERFQGIGVESTEAAVCGLDLQRWR